MAFSYSSLDGLSYCTKKVNEGSQQVWGSHEKLQTACALQHALSIKTPEKSTGLHWSCCFGPGRTHHGGESAKQSKNAHRMVLKQKQTGRRSAGSQDPCRRHASNDLRPRLGPGYWGSTISQQCPLATKPQQNGPVKGMADPNGSTTQMFISQRVHKSSVVIEYMK